MNFRATKLLTLMLGMVLASAGAATAAPQAPLFYEGKLSGTELQGWTLWLSTTNSEALGITFTTNSPAGDHLVAVRGEGSVKKKGSGNSIDLKLYAVNRESPRIRIGRLHAVAQSTGAAYEGRVTLAGRSGRFTAAPVPSVPANMTGLTGTYLSQRADSELALKLAADGSFLMEGRVMGRTAGRAIGNWQVDTEGYLWLLPTSVAESNEFFDLSFKLRVPLKLRTIRSGSQLDLYEPIRNAHFASFTRQ